MSAEKQSLEDEAKLKLAVLKSTAVRQAMVEVLGENRTEIVRRARAKLTAMGVQLAEDEVGAAEF